MSRRAEKPAPRETLGRLRVGFVELIDAAPLIAAAALGYFADECLDVVLSRELGWGNVRDKLQFERLDAAHCVLGMPIRAAIDEGPAAATRIIVALGSGGDAITLSRRLVAAGVTSGVALGRYVRDGARAGGKRLTFAHVSNDSVHHYALRAWLERAGIDPDRDVTLKVCPPPQVGRLMAAGHIDGFCSGEPWNLLEQERGEGRIVGLTADLMGAHPNKVLVANKRWLARSRPAAVALVRAVRRGAVYCAEPGNAEPLAAILARPEYLDVPADTILRSLRLDRRFGVPAGAGEVRPRDWAMRSFEPARPDAARVGWFVGQMQRWNHVAAGLDVAAIANASIDPTLFDDAAAPPPRPATSTSRRAKETMSPFTVTRRHVLRAAGTAALALALTWGPRVALAAEPPEKTELKFGFIKLTDCAPIVIAKEKGFFDDEFLNVQIEAQSNWKVLLDRVISGELDGAHMLAGQPIGATVGIGTKAHVVTAMSLDLNGNAITVSDAVWKKMQEAAPELQGSTPKRPVSAKALKPQVDAAKSSGTPLKFGMVFPVSTHNYELRYWLAAGGISPGFYTSGDTTGTTDADVLLSVTPPPQMPATLQAGTIQGYCVGEPWNQQAVFKGIGVPVITDYEIWKNNPEKVFGVTADWDKKYPNTHIAVLKALIRAAKWLDEPGNRDEACAILAKPEYVGADKAVIANSMTGTFEYQKGEKLPVPDFNVFFKHYANYPYYSDCIWYLTQMRRWGQIGEAKPDGWYVETAKSVYLPDVYKKATDELIKEGKIAASDVPQTDGFRAPTSEFIDGVEYDGRKPNDYLKSLKIGLKD